MQIGIIQGKIFLSICAILVILHTVTILKISLKVSFHLMSLGYLNSVPVLSVIVFNSTCVTRVQHVKPGKGNLVLFAPLKYKQEEILPSFQRLLSPKVHLAPDGGIHQE